MAAISKARILAFSSPRHQYFRLVTAQGKAITGLPNPEGYGANGETPVDRNGHELGTDIDGIDSEGLVVMRDGSFWVADEYGPHIVHFTEDGRQQERISLWGSESNTGQLALPAVLPHAARTLAWKVWR